MSCRKFSQLISRVDANNRVSPIVLGAYGVSLSAWREGNVGMETGIGLVVLVMVIIAVDIVAAVGAGFRVVAIVCCVIVFEFTIFGDVVVVDVQQAPATPPLRTEGDFAGT